jgi:iron complex transport system substrate-binding protein
VHRSITGLKYIQWLLIFSFLFGAGVSQAGGNIIVRDARGKTFRCGAYSRIVSLAPNITEILFFVKAEGLVKGVTRFCNYPEEAASIEKIGGISDVDVEKIISLDPDLVIATKDGNPRRAVDFLEGAAIPSFVINPRNIKETLDTMEKVACLSGAPADVFSKIDSMRRDLAGFARTRSGRKARVLFLVSQSPMIAAGRGTFINEMINLSGGINVVEQIDFSYPRLGIEGILSLSPDVIFWVTSMGENVSAGQLERVEDILGSDQIKTIAVDPDIYTRPGPRLFEGMREIGEILSGLR